MGVLISGKRELTVMKLEEETVNVTRSRNINLSTTQEKVRPKLLMNNKNKSKGKKKRRLRNCYVQVEKAVKKSQEVGNFGRQSVWELV